MDRRNPFHLHDHQLYQLFQQQQLTPPPQSTTAAMDLGGGGERIPKWSIDETKELLGIREELDQTFMETKRNKLLWEVVAAKMADKGFARSAEQCKSKWKNLVTRYKVTFNYLSFYISLYILFLYIHSLMFFYDKPCSIILKLWLCVYMYYLIISSVVRLTSMHIGNLINI